MKTRIIKLLRRRVRNEMLVDGGLDGRFRMRVVEDKKRKANRRKCRDFKADLEQ